MFLIKKYSSLLNGLRVQSHQGKLTSIFSNFSILATEAGSSALTYNKNFV